MFHCVGIVPQEFSDLFADRLRKFAPLSKVSVSTSVSGGRLVAELYVSPAFGVRKSAEWNAIWWSLKAQASLN
jgi:hypothetical protein